MRQEYATRPAILFAAALLVGCAGGDPDPGSDDGPTAEAINAAVPLLPGTEWGPVDAPDIFIRFDLSGISGNGGCNSLSASYERSGDNLSFGPVRTTRMACEPAVMEREQDFIEALGLTAEVATEDDGKLGLLVLRDAGGEPLAKLQRRDFD